MSAKSFHFGFRIAYCSWQDIRIQFYLIFILIDLVWTLNKASHLKKFYIEVHKI
jgi:hypothetical protein